MTEIRTDILPEGQSIVLKYISLYSKILKAANVINNNNNSNQSKVSRKCKSNTEKARIRMGTQHVNNELLAACMSFLEDIYSCCHFIKDSTLMKGEPQLRGSKRKPCVAWVKFPVEFLALPRD